MARRLHVEPLEGIGFVAGEGLVEVFRCVRELGGEFSDKIGGNFVAARADGRTDGGEEIGGSAVKFLLHATDGFLGDSGEGTTPTCMDSSNGTFLGINQENRDTVGSLDSQKNSGLLRRRGVAFAGINGGLREQVNDVGMNLLEGSEAQVRGLEGGLKPAAVFPDIFWVVPFHKAEVEDALGFELAYTLGTSAEAVSEPGKFSESGEFENLQASGSANVPRGGDCRMHRSGMTAESRGRSGARARRGSFLF